MIDAPDQVVVSRLGPGQRVTVTITSTDAQRVPWRGRTTVRADSQGQVSVDAAALIATMSPQRIDPYENYQWAPGGRASFLLNVAGVHLTLIRSLTRHAVRQTPVSAQGLVGTYFDAGLPGRHSAVLLIGGSNGGLPGSLLPNVLAGAGHPVLALAYFNAPGLPQTLSNIPLEYFATALRWLARQPGVDRRRVVIEGVSRGGEAALLIAATYPGLVHGVVAGVPSDAAICSYPGCKGPAWTLNGKPVPYTRQFSNPDPTDNPKAIIDVRRIDGPVLLNCADGDQIWNSCGYANAVMARLRNAKFPHQLQECQLCNHFVAWGVPGEPYNQHGPIPITVADIYAYPRFFTATLKLLGS